VRFARNEGNRTSQALESDLQLKSFTYKSATDGLDEVINPARSETAVKKILSYS
jgi:hypothetical protein